MFVFGLVSVLAAGGAGAYLGWENRDVIVAVHAGGLTWRGHLYAVLVVGALLACWAMLGAAFVQCRIAEKRAARRQRAAQVHVAAADAPTARRRTRRGAGRPATVNGNT